jgi:hypothetical protein
MATLIGTLRRTYGENFAGGVADTKKLGDVFHRLDDDSVSQLLRSTQGAKHGRR